MSFALKNLEEVNYFLGLKAHKNEAGLVLCQAKYGHDLLVKTNMQDTNPFTTHMAVGLKMFLEDNEFFEEQQLIRVLQELFNTC